MFTISARRALSMLLLAATLLNVRAAFPDEPAFSAADIEFFEKDVRPVLVARCHECHSKDSKDGIKGGLRLDSRQALLDGGDTGPAVIPGKPKESLLVDAINYGELYQMPPKSRLPDAEVAVLTKWVARGAPWPAETSVETAKADEFNLEARKAAHWCWQPIKTYAPPAVQNQSWPRSDLDRFILAKLEEKGLTPATPATKRELIRRVYFDLIGLPPSPEAVERFEKDSSPQAFERVVDELLESPHFGERWARHWMDLVRYAETCGHEFDYPIPFAWRYRDYLIRAFNQDVPYDQLVLEHIAGDLLENPRRHRINGTNESIIGTNFWFLHEAIHAPVDSRSDWAGRIDNQIDVMSKTFLGVTVSCARCHDHKFDAISTKDYYALAGSLKSSRRHEALLDPHDRIHEIAGQVKTTSEAAEKSLDAILNNAAEFNGKQFSQYLLAARELAYGEPDKKEIAIDELHRRNVNQVAKEFGVDPERLAHWVATLAVEHLDDPSHPLHAWKKLAMRTGKPGSRELAKWRDEVRSLAEMEVSKADKYHTFADFDEQGFEGWFTTSEAFGTAPTRAGQLNLASSRAQVLPAGIAHSGQLGGKFQGALRSPTFTINHRNIYYRLAGKACEVRLIVDGYTMIEFHQLLFGGMKFPVETQGKFTWHRQSGDLGMYIGHPAYFEILDYGEGWAAIDEICFSDLESPPRKVSPTSKNLAGRAWASMVELARYYDDCWEIAKRNWQAKSLTNDDVRILNLALPDLVQLSSNRSSPDAAEYIQTRERIASLVETLPSPDRVVAMQEGTGANERVFIRGNPKTLGEEAPRQLLVALVGNSPITSGSGRLTIARQITDPKNPLTSRVMVNRVWQHLFGRGLVATVDNFGVLGEQPTHPELLDYLAQQFVTEGWSIKRLIRSLALSSTYQMSTASDARASEIDPRNELLHAMRIRRLEGEAIRDAMLAISGRLDSTLYGPSVPVHITPFMQGRGRPGGSGPLDGNGRRSIYIEVRRNFLSPMMLAFDTPVPFSTVGRRNASNVPAQALILMNDPFVAEQAQRWAKQIINDSNASFADRVNRAYVSAIAREATPAELSQAEDFFATQGRELGLSPEQSLTDLRMWSDFCHVLFNVKEFVFLK